LPVSRGNYLVIESGGTGVFFSMSFNQLGLSAELLRSVTRQGYQQPTPIQQRVIPLILEVAGLRSGDRFRNAQSPHPSGMRA
jgi:superfamily II DNA/RNA helicase